MARVHTDLEVARLLLHQKRYAIVGQSDFTRDAVRIQETLRHLIRLLLAFQPYSAQVIRDAWAAARLPPVASDDYDAKTYLDAADELPREAAGFEWACRAFLATLETEVISYGRGRTRRRSRAERNR